MKKLLLFLSLSQSEEEEEERAAKQHHKSCSTSSFLVNNDNRVTLRLSGSAHCSACSLGGNAWPAIYAAQAADCARPANCKRLQMDGQQFFLCSLGHCRPVKANALSTRSLCFDHLVKICAQKTGTLSIQKDAGNVA